MKRFLLLSLCGLLALAVPTAYADGYWVLKDSSVSSGQTKASKKLKWKIQRGRATLDGGVTFTWEDPPKRIRLGEEEDLVFHMTVLMGNAERLPDPNPALEAMSASASVTVMAYHTGQTEQFYMQQFGHPSSMDHTWRTNGTHVTRTLRRMPEEDMHMDTFTPTRESRLTITVTMRIFRPGGPDALNSTGFNSFLWESTATQVYTYEFVGDLPEYNYETDASDDPGEDKGLGIPPAVFWIGGGTVGGAVLVNQIRKRGGGKKKGKNKDKGDDDPKPKKPSSYKMILYKEFGNTLRLGDPPVIVGARIEETTADGYKVDRPDLTQTIRISEGENIHVLATGNNGKYRCAKIQVPDP